MKKKLILPILILTIIILFIVISFVPTLRLYEGGNTQNTSPSLSPEPAVLIDHGVAVPESSSRGIIAAKDSNGRDTALIWLYDIRGTNELLMIDTDTGNTKNFSIPFDNHNDAPYASIFASNKKLYTLFGNYFVEFDPSKENFTFYKKTTHKSAMSLTEADDGTIWAATYPDMGLFEFNPNTHNFTDYGSIYSQNWDQYPRNIATDDKGIVYVSIGYAATQILIFNPRTHVTTPVLSEDERGAESAQVWRHTNGKVYAQYPDSSWYELYDGKATKTNKPDMKAKSYLTGDQNYFYKMLPSGRLISGCDLIQRTLTTTDANNKNAKTVTFNYSTEGAVIMAVATAPDGSIFGGTAFPFRFFDFKTDTQAIINHNAYGQWNTLGASKTKAYIGGYTSGFLLEWDPSGQWVDTVPDKYPAHYGYCDSTITCNPVASNPLYLTNAAPDINRPTRLLVHPDGKLVILAGTPDYGMTGGGLMFWDTDNNKSVVLDHTRIVENQATESLVALTGNKLLGGTTTDPGSGGVRKAKDAELYIMDLDNRSVEWHEAIIPGVQHYTDMILDPNGLVFGFADQKTFFVFDPTNKKIIHQESTSNQYGSTVLSEGPRVFVHGSHNQTYILFEKSIARLNPDTFAIQKLTDTPLISSGGAYSQGRIYFASGSHLFSYKDPES